MDIVQKHLGHLLLPGLAIFLSPNYTLAAQANLKVIAVSDEWSPLVSVKAAEAPMTFRADRPATDILPGYGVELLSEALRFKSIDLELQIVDWSKALKQTEDASADIIIGLATRETVKLKPSRLAIATSQTCFFKNKAHLWEFEGLPSLDHVKIGASDGYTYDEALDFYFRKNAARMILVSGNDPFQGLVQELFAQRIDVFVEEKMIFDHRASTGDWGQKKIANAGCLDTGKLYFGFPSTERGTKLRSMVDEGLEKLRANGFWKRVMEKYGLKD